MRNWCVVVGFVLVSVSEVCGLECYHCGWSRQRKNYRTRDSDLDEELPYPVAERHMARNDAEQAELSNPPTRGQLEKYCRKQSCSVKNDACVTWSFKSSHPINITYMCVGNPKKLSGCYSQKRENKDFREIEVCLCSEDLCNDARTTTDIKLLTVALCVFVVLAL